MRGFVLALAIGLGVEACVCVWKAFTEPGNWDLIGAAVLLAGFSGFAFRYFARSSVTLTSDAVIVANAFKDYTVPLTEITGVVATSRGLQISRGDLPVVVAGAVQKSQWSMDHATHSSHADAVAEEILDACSRSHQAPDVATSPAPSPAPATAPSPEPAKSAAQSTNQLP